MKFYWGDKKLLDYSALAYLYISIFIFFLTWIQLVIAIPLVCLSLVGIIVSVRGQQKSDVKLNISFGIFCFVSLVLIVIWCCLSGIGGYALQPSDWIKHNLILNDLIDMPWPVRYQYGDESGVLCYYIAEYLLPAAIGKIWGFDAASTGLLIWVVLGLFLTVLLLYSQYGNNKAWILPVIVFCVFSFATLLGPISGIYRGWFPDDVSDGFMWLSNTVRIQYSSNITMLRWVFPQFVPTAVAVALLFRYRNQYEIWGLCVAPLALYSTFAFVGMAGLLVLLFVFDCIKNCQIIQQCKRLVSIGNIAACLDIILQTVYIGGNVLQEKPETSLMGFSVIDYSDHIWVLIAFEIAWMLWTLLLIKKELHNGILWVASISLFLFPFFTMGEWNDFCMRASIPALLCLCFLVTKNLVQCISVEKYKDVFFAGVLVSALLLGGIGNYHELYAGYTGADHSQRNYCVMGNGSSIEWFLSRDVLKYQYIDWSDSDLNTRILR